MVCRWVTITLTWRHCNRGCYELQRCVIFSCELKEATTTFDDIICNFTQETWSRCSNMAIPNVQYTHPRVQFNCIKIIDENSQYITKYADSDYFSVGPLEVRSVFHQSGDLYFIIQSSFCLGQTFHVEQPALSVDDKCLLLRHLAW